VRRTKVERRLTVRPLPGVDRRTHTFLPPYSPDLNPIEECWSKVKSLLRSAAARTKDELNQALSTILELVTPSDACGWIGHAGYRLEP
jgi:transposase